MTASKFSVVQWLQEPNSKMAYAVICLITVFALYGFSRFCHWLFNFAKHYEENHKHKH